MRELRAKMDCSGQTHNAQDFRQNVHGDDPEFVLQVRNLWGFESFSERSLQSSAIASRQSIVEPRSLRHWPGFGTRCGIVRT
jgi:hypothetical protein